MGNNPLRSKTYHRVFIEYNGPGPWPCADSTCSKPVEKIGQRTWDGNVHHVDEDLTNDHPSNLVIMHVICHQHQHPVTLEIAARISAKLKGRPSPTRGLKFSAEVCAKHSQPGASNPFYGRTHTSDTLVKMRQPRQRALCPDCGQEFAINWLTRHKTVGRCG